VEDAHSGNTGQADDKPLDGLDLKTAARVLRVTTDTLRKRIERGKVDAYKDGGRWYVVLTEADIQTRQAPVYKKPQSSGDASVLYERIITLTAEAARYKAIAEVSESTRADLETDYQNQIAALKAENEQLKGRLEKRWWQRKG